MRSCAALFLALAIASCTTGADQIPANPRVEKFTLPNTTTTFEMVYIPGGRFRPEGAAEEVEVKPFWIGKCEVTWDEYEVSVWNLLPDVFPIPEMCPPTPYEPPDQGMGRGRHPYVNGKRHNAEWYCKRLSLSFGKKFRLPTEAEWEFVCRAGGASHPLGDFAWYAENSGGAYHEVGLKKPNGFGLHDMLGNVWEYCLGGGEVPVVRGGGWNSSAADCRAGSRLKEQEEWYARDPNRPRSRWWYTDAPFVGFRLVREVEPGEK